MTLPLRQILLGAGGADDAHPVDKPELLEWGTWVEQLTQLAYTSGRVYTSKAAMNADLTPDANLPALVIGDAIPGNDGLYRKVGATGTGSWVQVLDFVPGAQFVFATISGTANALVATPNMAVSAGGHQIVYAVAAYENTASSVTIKFPNLLPLTVKSHTGADIVAEGIQPNMPLLGVVSGATFRLLNEQATAAILAQVENALQEVITRSDDVALKWAETLAAAALTVAAADATGVFNIYDTYADANAALGSIPANAVVEVMVDETRGAARTRYRKSGGVLVFKINMPRERVVRLFTGSTSFDAVNTALIQAALNAKGKVILEGTGDAYTSAALEIGLDTDLEVGAGLNIKRNHPGNLLISKGVTRAWDAATVVWPGGLVANIGWPAHGKVVGDIVWLRGVPGTSPGEFFGLFQVKSVTDANNFVVHLWRVPSGSPSGSYQIKATDKNIKVHGAGTWDYNGTALATGAGYLAHALVFAGVSNLDVDVLTYDVTKFTVCMAGVTDIKASSRASITKSDGIKLYGPAKDVVIHSPRGLFGDDTVSLHCMETGVFSSYDFSGGGDILSVKVTGGAGGSNLDANPGRAPTIYADPNFWIDGIIVEHMLFPMMGTTAGIYLQTTPSLTGGRIGTVIIREIMVPDFKTANVGYVTVAGQTTVKQLILEKVTLPKAVTTAAGLSGSLLRAETGAIIERLDLVEINGRKTGYLIDIADATVKRLVLDKSDLDASGAAAQHLLRLRANSTLGDVVMRDSSLVGYNSLIRAEASGLSPLVYAVFERCIGDYVYLAQITGTPFRVKITGNRTSDSSGHLITSSAAVTVDDAGDNVLAGTKAIATATGGGSVTHNRKPAILVGSKTHNFASIADGGFEETTVTVTGAVLGDIASASLSITIAGIILTAYVSAADTVTVRAQNETGGAVDLASATLRAIVMKIV